MSQFVPPGGQSIGASASASVLPMTIWASLVAQTEESPPAVQETRVQSLAWEDPLVWPPTPGAVATHSERMAIHSSILA